MLEALLTAAVDQFPFTKNKGSNSSNSKKATLKEAARNRTDAPSKATKKDSILLKGGISPGEELGGLTLNLRV